MGSGRLYVLFPISGSLFVKLTTLAVPLLAIFNAVLCSKILLESASCHRGGREFVRQHVYVLMCMFIYSIVCKPFTRDVLKITVNYKQGSWVLVLKFLSVGITLKSSLSSQPSWKGSCPHSF